jgi:predicted naringenin-chalcone synthase
MTVYWLGHATQTPDQIFSQEELFRMAGYSNFPVAERRKFQALFRAVGVESRAMCLSEQSPEESNDESNEGQHRPSEDPNDFHSRYLSGVRQLAPQVALKALRQSGISVNNLDFLVFVSCTGYTCPGFSAELAHTLGMRPDRPTANLLGMGCSGLVPGLELAWSHLESRPGTRAMVVITDICSATYWIDQDPETAVGNALFGDGAGAIVLSSSKSDMHQSRDQGKIIGIVESFRTLRDGRYLSEMGFAQRDGRLRVRLAKEIPDRIVPLVLQMFRVLEMNPHDRLAIHPGGRKILDRLEKELLPQSSFWKSSLTGARQILRELGNMSSPTVLFVLDRSFRNQPLEAQTEKGSLLTMGPGLSVEAVRVEWQAA